MDISSFLNFLRLRPILWSETRRISFGILLMIISLAIGLYLPLLNKDVFDVILPSKDIRGLILIGLEVSALIFINYIVRSLHDLIFTSASLRINAKIRASLFKKLTKISNELYSQYLKGDLQDILWNDVSKLIFLQLNKVAKIVMNIVNAGVIAVIMSLLSVPLALCTFVYAIVLVLCTMVFSKKIYSSSVSVTTARSRLNSNLFEMLGAMPLIRVSSVEERETKRFSGLLNGLNSFKMTQEKVAVFVNGLIMVVENIMPFIIFLWGVLLMIRNKLMLGELIAFSMYFGRFKGAVSGLVNSNFKWQRTKPSLDRVVSLLELPDEAEDSSTTTHLDDFRYEIKVCNASFSRSGVEILKDISMTVPKGKLVAIVGHNGCGKTTLLKIFSGQILPTRGKVLIDGHTLSSIDKREFRRLCGFVFQGGILMNRTIRETICFRTNSLQDDRKVYDILDAVGLKEFVQHLPNQLYTLVGEMGGAVSGGELQRLAIGRELAYQPKLLFLDEAMSSVDHVGKSSVLNVLYNICKSSGLTVIYVTHSLADLQYADLIYMMENGCVIDSGSLDELGRDCNSFHNLFAAKSTDG
jgi:ATP-binding cassette subfamily B protein